MISHLLQFWLNMVNILDLYTPLYTIYPIFKFITKIFSSESVVVHANITKHHLNVNSYVSVKNMTSCIHFLMKIDLS